MSKNPPYKIVAICEDGSEVDLSENFYPSRGWCYATATKRAIDIAHDGNRDKLIRLEMRDKDNLVVPGYDNPADKLLLIESP